MVSILTADLRVYPDPDSVAAAAAEAVAAAIRAAVRRAGRATVALSGGTTPRLLYGRMAAASVPWPDVHLWWGDERYVPAGDVRSNCRMAHEAFIDRVAIPPDNVHPMPTTLADPDGAARAYEQLLERAFGAPLPRFDIVLLGLGDDGHIASLFPGSAALRETARRVVATQAPAAPRTRLTLTYPVLNNAASVQFVVTGAQKTVALRRALAGDCAPDECPASGVRPSHGDVIWWVDAEAFPRVTG